MRRGVVTLACVLVGALSACGGGNSGIRYEAQPVSRCGVIRDYRLPDGRSAAAVERERRGPDAARVACAEDRR